MHAKDLSPFFYFVNERHAIWLRKHYAKEFRGEVDELYDPRYDPLGPGGIPGKITPKQIDKNFFSTDPIFRENRFCNVFRELDRVTVWIRKNIREPYANHEHLWLMLAIARYVNWPPTLDFLIKNGVWPDNATFSPVKLGEALDHWKSLGNKTYTGAYMIRAESSKNAPWYTWSKQRYVAEIVLGRLWEDRNTIVNLISPCRCQTDDDFRSGMMYSGGCTDCLGTGYVGEQPTLKSCLEYLQHPRYIGWGPFMAFQTVLEWRHTRYLCAAPDASSWASLGPGSKRGLNRLFGRAVEAPLSQEQGLGEMHELLEESRREGVLGPHVPTLSMEDVQNCLCETDKYLRLKLKQGHVRAKYVPGRGW